MTRPIVFALLALLTPLLMSISDPHKQTRMSQARMEAIVKEIDPKAEGPPGAVEFRFEGLNLAVVSDVANDRMRVIAPIRPVSDLTGEQIARMFEANFHSALDARYATSGGVLYSAFLHPLGSLTEQDFRSAIRQVAALVRTFGSSYSSGELFYGAPR